MKRSLIVTFLILFFYFPFITNAQLPLGVDEQVSFELLPTVPEPNEQVTLKVTSYLTDLNKAKISWYINDVLFESSLGLREISFKSGPAGSTTNIKVVMEKVEGGILEKTFSVSPADVDVIRQAITYIRPFYEGKPLSSKGSDMKFIAIPNFVNNNGIKISSDQIVFNWNINGTTDTKNSGIGKNIYYYKGGLINRPIKVVLTASPANSNSTAREIKTFDYANPSIKFYKSDPILGTLYNMEIQNNYELVNKELEITAVPYYFSNSTMNFNWKINNETINMNGKKYINKLSFRRTNNEAGNDNISLEIKSKEKILQFAKNNFNLFYKETNNF